ncbi:MAG: tyrosine-type recombinase/integrase [Pseudomonadota bacterium]
MAARLKRGFYWRNATIWVRTDPIEGTRKSTGCTDPQAAYLWHAERERLAASPAYAAAARATVGRWADLTLETKEQERSEGTVHMYRVKLGHVARIFGRESPMASITAGAIDEYIKQRRTEGASSNTIARELTCLRQMLRYAKRAGEYAEDIDTVMPIGFSAEYVPVKRTLKREDLPKLLAALPGERERAWVCFALCFAADRSDIERARPEDYDEARNVFHVRGTKTAVRDAELPVLPMFRELFEYALARLPVSWPSASNGVGRACTKAGLPHLSPKDLRRSTCTWLIEAGVDQAVVSRFMRHVSDQMVRRIYGQVSPTALGKLIETGLASGTEASQVLVPVHGFEPRFRDSKCDDAVSADPERAVSCEKRAARPGLKGHEETRDQGASGTEASHAPAAWSLALAAESALRHRVSITLPVDSSRPARKKGARHAG